MLVRVIVAADDPTLRARLVQLVQLPAVHIVSATSRERARAQLGALAFDLALVASRAIDPALQALPGILAAQSDSPQLIALLDSDAPDAQAQLVAAGAMAVLDARLDDALLGPALRGLVAARQAEVHRQPSTAAPPSEFIYRSPGARVLLDKIPRIASADSAVLILGETGVGKEHIAEQIHRAGARASGPFVPVNCGAIPSELFESELFGHERGAFTGAHRARRGVFELAHGGTLFLDEVAEVPANLQVKLLRTLQDGRLRPLGSETTIEVDVRVVAATNQDLAAAMADGSFRRDLYYRLSVVELQLPPLRERPEDVIAMAHAFVARFVTQLGRPVEGFEDETLAAIVDYSWPGNVRELRNAIERAVLLCDGRQLRLIDLPASVAACATLQEPNVAALGIPRPNDGQLPQDEIVRLPKRWATEPWRVVREGVLVAAERAYLSELMAATGGKVGEAAARAGISTRALFDKMRRHGLKKEDFRRAELPR